MRVGRTAALRGVNPYICGVLMKIHFLQGSFLSHVTVTRQQEDLSDTYCIYYIEDETRLIWQIALITLMWFILVCIVLLSSPTSESTELVGIMQNRSQEYSLSFDGMFTNATTAMQIYLNINVPGILETAQICCFNKLVLHWIQLAQNTCLLLLCVH